MRRYALIAILLTGCSAEPERTWELTAQGIYTGAISSDARYALVGSLNHGASLWRISDYERLYDWNHKADTPVELVSAAFSPDGTRAVTTDARTLVVWDTASGESLQYWGTPGAVLDTVFLPDGTDVLMGLEDHSALLFDSSDGTHKQTFLHEGQVTTVAISEDGRIAATGSDDHRTIVWSIDTGNAVREINHGNPVREIALSADGATLFTAITNDRVALWRASTGELLHELHASNPGVTSATFSDDGSLLLLGTVNRDVELWHVATGERRNRWRVGARNPWRPTGGAVLALGFTSSPGDFRALAGDGRLIALRG